MAFPNRKAYQYLNLTNWIIRRVYLIEEKIFITQEKEDPKEMELRPIITELERIIGVCEARLQNLNHNLLIEPAQPQKVMSR
jgi:hypothetical protein